MTRFKESIRDCYLDDYEKLVECEFDEDRFIDQVKTGRIQKEEKTYVLFFFSFRLGSFESNLIWKSFFIKNTPNHWLQHFQLWRTCAEKPKLSCSKFRPNFNPMTSTCSDQRQRPTFVNLSSKSTIYWEAQLLETLKRPEKHLQMRNFDLEFLIGQISPYNSTYLMPV